MRVIYVDFLVVGFLRRQYLNFALYSYFCGRCQYIVEADGWDSFGVSITNV